MKYYVAQLEEINGEYAYQHTFTLKAKYKQQALEMLDKLAETWYSGEMEQRDEYYMHHGGAVAVTPHKLTEVKKREYKVTKEIVNDLTHLVDLEFKKEVA